MTEGAAWFSPSSPWVLASRLCGNYSSCPLCPRLQQAVEIGMAMGALGAVEVQKRAG